MKRQFGRKLLLAIVASAATSAIPLLNRLILSDAVPFADRGLLAQIALLSITSGLVSSILSGILSFAILQERYQDFERSLVATFQHMLSLAPATIRAYAPGDVTRRIYTYVTYRCEMRCKATLLVFGHIIALPSFVQMFFFLPRAACGFTLFLLISFGAHMLAFRYASVALASAQKADGEFAGLLARFLDGVEKIRAACAEEACFAQLSRIYNRLCASRLRAHRILGFVGLFSFVTTSVALLLTYVTSVALRGTPDAPTAGDCIAFVAAAGIVAGVCPTAFAAFEMICQHVRAKERIRPMLEAIPEDCGGDVTAAPLGDVEMLHVSFSYDGNRKILDDVSLHARPGEVIAIVGPSGAGKSTLIRLLLGFDRPHTGEIHYDGIDLRNRDVRSLRRHMGVVMQNAASSPTSILHNILGSSTDLTADDAWAAAEAAAVADDIRAMPMGLQTILSQTSVSGGQRQRILIARALVRKPKILIFDEATSALDNISQRIVNRTLISQIGVTEIIVAHRLSTIRAADRIYVLDQGRVVEEGTYDALLARGGLFTELARRQLAESNK